jgi:hypothetical protein
MKPQHPLNLQQLNRLLQRASLFFLAIACVELLVTCGPNRSIGNIHENKPQKQIGSQTGSNSSPIGSRDEAQGTSDSGGGTGFDGKVFLSYVVDPTTLPSYKQKLSILLKNIGALDSKPENQGPQSSLESFFKLKTWYFAPVDFTKLDKSTLGISFIKSKTQQIGRQTLKAVWIDSRIFDNMGGDTIDQKLQFQADTLLHEFVEGLYLIKFTKFSEICKSNLFFQTSASNSSSTKGTNDNRDEQNCDPSKFKLIDEFMAPETARPLTEIDYENIDYAETWIKQNALRPMHYSSFKNMLKNHNFDKRLFAPEQAQILHDSPALNLSITGIELNQAIQNALIAGDGPRHCVDPNSNRNQDCKVTVTSKQIPWFYQKEIQGLELQIAFPSQNNLSPSSLINMISMDLIAGDEITLAANGEDANGNILYSFSPLTWKQAMQVGDKLYQVAMIFKKSKSNTPNPLYLDSIMIKPSIVASITKLPQPVCLTRPYRGDSPWENGFIIRSELGAASLAEAFYHALETNNVFCNSLNLK